MIIRDSQIAALRASLEASFEQRMVISLRRKFVAFAADRSDQEIREFVNSGRARAATYGIDTEIDVEHFIEYAVIHGERFDLLPWAQKILTTDGVDGSKKTDWIDEYDQFVLNRDWNRPG